MFKALSLNDLAAKVRQAVLKAQAAGGTGEQRRKRAVRELARLIDDRLTWGKGPVGRIAEWLDGRVLELVLGGIVEATYRELRRQGAVS